MDYKKITQLSYEATAHEFSRNVADLAPLASLQKFVRLLPPKAKILDIGCGSGRDCNILSEMGFDVVGIDLCHALLEIAKKNAPSAHFLQMDVEQLSFSDRSFEGIWSACSLAHLSKNKFPEVLKTLYRLLTPGGCFYLSLKKGKGEGVQKDGRYGGCEKFWAYYEKEEVDTLLQAVPFKVLEYCE